jgi:phage baseplate assembly protein W
VTDVPHFSLPFRFATPYVAVSEQDSIDEIADCVLAILSYPLGYRVELPSFGLPDPTFSSPVVDIDEIRTVVERWEERASAQLTQQHDAVDELITRVLMTLQVQTQE